MRGGPRETEGSPLLRVLDRPRLADHGHLDLARVLDVGFDLVGDLAGDDGGAVLVDLLGQDDDPQFAPPAILETLVAAGKLGQKSGEGFFRYSR